jgi:hypothetical protein
VLALYLIEYNTLIAFVDLVEFFTYKTAEKVFALYNNTYHCFVANAVKSIKCGLSYFSSTDFVFEFWLNEITKVGYKLNWGLVARVNKLNDEALIIV